MTRVRDLDFRARSALYNPDGSGAAEIERTEDASGGCWARIAVPGGGIEEEFVYIRHHVDEHVFAVDGDAEAVPPAGGRTDLDRRFRSLGAYFSADSFDEARRAADELRDRLRVQNEAIREASFEVGAVIDGRHRRVRVGPTIAGRTDIECHADEHGGARVLRTEAERSTLERATREPIEIATSFAERRPIVGGMRARSLPVTLFPLEPPEHE